MVLKELNKDNVTVSKATISKIKNLKVFHSRGSQKIETGGRKRGPKFKLRPYQLKALEKDVTDNNPKTQGQLASKF